MSSSSGERPEQKRGRIFEPDESWRNATGRNIRVAIIDSGVDLSHPKLQSAVKDSFEASEQSGRIVFERSDSSDSAGHGTACSGIVNSIAPGAAITSIKVLGSGGTGDGNAFLAGLEFAINRGCDVINLSLGTTKSHLAVPLHDLLDRAYRGGSIIVSAANNLPKPSYPSVFSSSLISVSKMEGEDPLSFGFKFGSVIELTAPGVNVRTTWLNGAHRNLTGNSFACPHITGIICLLLETYPDLTPFEVKSLLYSIAQKNTAPSE